MGFWKQIELFFKALEKTFEDVGKLNKNTDRDLKKLQKQNSKIVKHTI